MMSQTPMYTGSVLVTIKASSEAEAKEHARKLKNFQLDESYPPVDMNDGTFLVRGTLTSGALPDNAWTDSGIAPYR